MLPQIDALSLSPDKVFSILVFHLLIHLNKAESQVVGPHQPVVALVDDDVILPCHVEPAEDVTAEILEWTRSDLDIRFVHVWRSGQDVVNARNPSYRGRTSLFINELKQGNISLKLSRVKLSDKGTYECQIPLMGKKSVVELVVASGASTSPVIRLSGIDKSRGVVLQCESAGWYPEPELLWLDAEGNLLSAGPTETLRGPDDLYTVSSRVTVEKRHSNNITCRVQQRNTNQSRETHIHVPEDFFDIPSSSSSAIIALAVCLALCIILLILSAVVLLCRIRKHMMKTIRRPKDQTDRGDDVSCEEAREREQLNTSSSSIKTKKQTSSLPITSRRKLLEEQQRREEAEKNLQDIKEKLQLEKNNTEITKQLQEEKETAEDLKNQLEKKNFELSETISQVQKEKQNMESEIKTLKNDLDSTKQKLEKSNIKIFNQFQQEKKAAEDLKKQLEDKDHEMIRSEREKDEIIQKLMQKYLTIESKFSECIIQQTESEKNNTEIIKQLQQTKAIAKDLKNQLDFKDQEVEEYTEIINQLQQEKETIQMLKRQLEYQNHELVTELEEEKKKTEEKLRKGFGAFFGRGRKCNQN